MQTDNEYRTSYSMWAIGAVPLLVAVDVANMTAMERSILTNPHVARMHIDPLGAPGVRIAVDATCATALPPTVMNGIPACQIWAKQLADGSVAVALYNSEPETQFMCGQRVTHCADGTTSNCCMQKLTLAKPHNITVDLSTIGLHSSSNFVVFDMWKGAQVQAGSASTYTAHVPPSGAVLLRVSSS